MISERRYNIGVMAKRKNPAAVAESAEPTDLDFFLMANLGQQTTGLPFVLWIAIGSGLQYDVRVWVSHSAKAAPSEMVSVAIRPTVHVVEGKLSASDLKLLRGWVELNKDVLVRYWNGEIQFTEDAINAIRPIKTR
jgi:hypothetical protein